LFNSPQAGLNVQSLQLSKPKRKFWLTRKNVFPTPIDVSWLLARVSP
jgi:hypothetical protein